MMMMTSVLVLGHSQENHETIPPKTLRLSLTVYKTRFAHNGLAPAPPGLRMKKRTEFTWRPALACYCAFLKCYYRPWKLHLK